MAYSTIANIRTLGLPVSYTDAEIQAQLDMWSDFIDRATRQWFESRAMVFKFDGNDSDTINFGVPIITITYLKVNDRTDELDTNFYKVYNGNPYPDDRKNPHITLVNDTNREVYTGSNQYNNQKFLKGRENQEVSGTFGYVESDGTTPLLIVRAVEKLVIEKITQPIYNPSGSSGSGFVIGSILEERTDGHSIKYSYPGGELEKRRVGFSGITRDPEILDIIRMYKAPIGIGTPAGWSTP